jgi:hypothetical protein
MLHPLDDHPLHQTPEPLSHPATGDRNFYDRFFFNGYRRDASLVFGVALGLYPNRGIADASVSVLRAGRQVSLHASRETRGGREPRVGPVALEVVEPMRALRVRVAANPHGLAGELLFRARTPAVEEPRFVRREGGVLVMDSTRFTQFGRWEGWLELDGERLALDPDSEFGCRDRSWGVRPVGERAAGPAAGAPQYFWLWAPLHFEDCCLHFDVNEDAAGARWHENGVRVPLLASDASPVSEAGIERMRAIRHRIVWEPGTRRMRSAEVELTGSRGERHALALEPLASFQMLGLGYLHPEWGHGLWKGPEALAAERWEASTVPPLDPRFLHVQQLCRARWGAREGLGVLEQLVIGPHEPSGFTGLLDGARGAG